jgi:hypothetical protein
MEIDSPRKYSYDSAVDRSDTDPSNESYRGGVKAARDSSNESITLLSERESQ